MHLFLSGLSQWIKMYLLQLMMNLTMELRKKKNGRKREFKDGERWGVQNPIKAAKRFQKN